MMEDDTQDIDHVINEYGPALLAIEGLESLSLALGKTGKPCLMIGTSKPVEKIRDALPKEIFRVDVEVTYIGKIEAQ